MNIIMIMELLSVLTLFVRYQQGIWPVRNML